MHIRPEKLIPQTVTIINRLKKADSSTGVDVWYKHTLTNCFWSVESNAQQSGTNTYVGASVSVQIPFKQEVSYLPYNEWLKGNMDTCFTVSPDDYIIRGEVEEEITAANIVKTLAKYEPNMCKIKLFEDLTFGGDGVDHRHGLLEQYANIYYVEGV